MKNRVAKKHARAYMDGRKEYPVREEMVVYDTDGNWCIKCYANMPTRVLRWVEWYATRAGWTGLHWTAPNLVGVIWPDELARQAELPHGQLVSSPYEWTPPVRRLQRAKMAEQPAAIERGDVVRPAITRTWMDDIAPSLRESALTAARSDPDARLWWVRGRDCATLCIRAEAAHDAIIEARRIDHRYARATRVR